MTVQISWRREGDNKAGFSISYMPGFYEVEDVTFGVWSKDEKRWSGKIPKTGNYYIYVVAHPVARYTLRVSVR